MPLRKKNIMIIGQLSLVTASRSSTLKNEDTNQFLQITRSLYPKRHVGKCMGLCEVVSRERNIFVVYISDRKMKVLVGSAKL